MKAHIDDNALTDHPPTLVLQPETANDQAALTRLVENYEVAGFGRNAETGVFIHVEVLLTKRIREGQ